MSHSVSLQQFKSLVGIKFQLYNSLFTSLPFHRIEKTGILVSLLLINCEEGYKKRSSPVAIIEDFFAKQTALHSEEEKLDMLFRFIQYIERQVVLFDALEDAAFTKVNDMGGKGTLKHLSMEIEREELEKALRDKLQDFTVQLVLTAHPTQFYTGSVLGIITDLTQAVDKNAEHEIYSYLQQLGRTPFFQKKKPTPFDEATVLIWYLRNIFYPAAGKIVGFLKTAFPDAYNPLHPIIKMGFWPGGDRDGNPFVKAQTTLEVAKTLRTAILKSYYADIRKMKRRLTFKGVDEAIVQLDKLLNAIIYGTATDEQAGLFSKAYLLQALHDIKSQLVYQHNSMFVYLVEDLINKIEVFGLHFASLDIRQESTIHTKMIDFVAAKVSGILPSTYTSLPEEDRINALANIQSTIESSVFTDDIQQDTLEVMKVVQQIQLHNGEAGCNRYIISQCQSALNAMEVLGLFLMSGWKLEDLSVDIVPLFETVDDLQHAAQSMQNLYQNKHYRAHLQRRGNKQTIMLGFSDGTKDGGYLMANWSIYKAKEALTAISKQYDIDVAFFDGRGGPPARGGGKTHQFYASMGKNISNKEIQLTIQGQTVSSNFGTIDAAQYNMEQLLHAGISNHLNDHNQVTFAPNQEDLLNQLAEYSYQSYLGLKNHPYFVDYLAHASPLKFYAETNIGSRPTKRGTGSKLSLKDLRAIPFVGAWSQIKQNVTGYYGVGSALQAMEKQGRLQEMQELYHDSLFFRTLIDNCEMAMQKCFFPLTAYLSEHPILGEIWNKIFDEYELTKKCIFKISGHKELMSNYPVDQLSIQMRERIVLPLITIQQYALARIREMEEMRVDKPIKKTYEKLAMRCSFGIINAGRNSA